MVFHWRIWAALDLLQFDRLLRRQTFGFACHSTWRWSPPIPASNTACHHESNILSQGFETSTINWEGISFGNMHKLMENRDNIKSTSICFSKHTPYKTPAYDRLLCMTWLQGAHNGQNIEDLIDVLRPFNSAQMRIWRQIVGLAKNWNFAFGKKTSIKNIYNIYIYIFKSPHVHVILT